MVKGEYISEIYRWYEDSMLMVNRRYQRKLVWSLEEKRQFIDTIIRDYPVPLFLIVNGKEMVDGVEYPRKEIIDGLQRIEAIVSFIKNEYTVKVDGIYYYFNLDAYPGNGALIRDGKLEQKSPALDLEVCRQFLLYQLPVTTIDANTSTVEDIFKRINSTGKKLSLQDLRQAGVSSCFSDLVRQTAMQIRGDFSETDVVGLSEMSKISLNSGGLNYGINVHDVFWIKQGIITEDGLRRSKDEEIIANLYNCILNDYRVGMSSKTLNSLYNEESRAYRDNEERISSRGFEDLMSAFLAVIDDLLQTFDAKKSTFSKLLFTHRKVHNKDLVFIVLFLALVQLHNEHYIIENYDGFSSLMKNLADKEMGDLISESESKWNTEVRNHLIERVRNCLRKGMVFREIEPKWKSKLVDILKYAEAEEQMYDFKVGLHNLTTGKFNSDVIPKIVKTLTAMANTCPGQDGFVILGVSDNEDTAKDFESHYDTTAMKYNNYYVTGINAESVKYYGSVQKFLDEIKKAVEKEKVSEAVLHELLASMSLVPYGSETVLVFKLSSTKPLFYDKKLYVRRQSHNTEVTPGSDEFYEVWNKFNSLS